MNNEVYNMGDLARSLRNKFPELTYDGSLMIVSELVRDMRDCLERGQPLVLYRLGSFTLPVRTRVSGYFGVPEPEPRPVHIINFRAAEDLRKIISELPISEEEMKLWKEKRDYNKKRTQSFMYKGD